MLKQNTLNDEIFRWFSKKPRPYYEQKINDDMLRNLTENCLLVPGPKDEPMWHHPESKGFFYAKSKSTLVCAHQKLFHTVSGPTRSSTECNEENCEATWSFPEKDDQTQHNHPCIVREEAQLLCYNWAVDLLSCAVGNSSWLAIGVGHLSNYWPTEVLLRNCAEHHSVIDSAMLSAAKRSCAEKRLYLTTFTIEKLMRLCASMAPIVDNESLEALERWESFSRCAYDLVKGALDWASVHYLDKRDGMVPLSPPATLSSEPMAVDDATATDSEDCTQRSHQSEVAEKSFEGERGTETSPKSQNEVPSNVCGESELTPVLQTLRAPSSQPPTKKICTPPSDEIEIDRSHDADNGRSSRKTPKRKGRPRTRITPARRRPRSFGSKNASKGNSTPNQQLRDASPLSMGSLHGVPDSMTPIVVLHRLPDHSLDKLNKQNGVISLTDLRERSHSSLL